MIWLRASSNCAWIIALIGCAFGVRAQSPPPKKSPAFCSHHLAEPSRTVVEKPCGTAVAVFTDGARSVALVGPQRRFAEPTASSAIVTHAWVRALSAPFAGSLEATTIAWLESALADQSPDL